MGWQISHTRRASPKSVPARRNGYWRVAAGAGFELPTFFAETPGSYPAAFTAMRSAGVEALIIVSAPEFNRDAEILAALAVETRLPTVCE